MRTIIAAALKINGLVAFVERPGRHHHAIHALARGGYPSPVGRGDEQGFVTSEGAFVSRREAMMIAIEAKQLIPREGQHGPGGHLFSEDLW
jgi:hypothetical protein